ncbi:MAG: orotate phosphoribosyltransferase, partial [Marinirhabdus sp.]|nr:orotate phosphoribosyltransferase [Marinirhabdus sp.]
MMAIFTYGFDTSISNFREAGISLHTLSDYKTLLAQAEKSNYINANEANVLSDWREDPAKWNPAVQQ